MLVSHLFRLDQSFCFKNQILNCCLDIKPRVWHNPFPMSGYLDYVVMIHSMNFIRKGNFWRDFNHLKVCVIQMQSLKSFLLKCNLFQFKAAVLSTPLFFIDVSFQTRKMVPSKFAPRCVLENTWMAIQTLNSQSDYFLKTMQEAGQDELINKNGGSKIAFSENSFANL